MSTKHTLLGGGGQWKNMSIPYTLAHILLNSWQIYHLKNVDVYTF